MGCECLENKKSKKLFIQLNKQKYSDIFFFFFFLGIRRINKSKGKRSRECGTEWSFFGTKQERRSLFCCYEYTARN